MHQLIDRPILAYPKKALEEAGADRIVIVAGYEAQSLMDAFPDAEFAIQHELLGTGHAVMQAQALKDEEGLTLVMNGDVPCLQPETLKKLYEAGKDSSLVLLSAILEDGLHYGRVVREEDGSVSAIVEAKDCNEDQKQIREINAGVYCFNNRDLFESLSELTTDNAQHEYYLTDLVKILHNKGKKVQAIPADDPDEMAGINTKSELAQVQKWMQHRINQKWLDEGVQIMDPERTMIGPDVQFGKDVLIYPDTELTGKTWIGDNVEIGSFSSLHNAAVHAGSKVRLCRVENAELPEDSQTELTVIKEGTNA